MSETTRERTADIPVIDPPSEPAALARPEQQARPQVVEHPSSSAKPSGPSLLEHSPDVTELLKGLVKATLAFDEIEFDRNAVIRSDKGQFGYQWASLKEINKKIRRPLAENGLVLMHGARVHQGASGLTVRTELWHVSGQWMRTDLPVGIFGSDPRAVGTGITYAKRYNVLALLNLSPGDDEDDDGEVNDPTAVPRTAPKPAQRVSQRKEKAEKAEPQTQVPPTVHPPTTAPTAATSAAPAVKNIGVIDRLEQRGDVWKVGLDTGFVCATKSKELAEALVMHKSRRPPVRLELRYKASTDPARFLPTLEEIIVVG